MMEYKIVGDWGRFSNILANFKPNLEREIERATALNGALMTREIRQEIKKKKYDPNKPFTIAIKRSTTPLIDHAELWRAITWVRVNWDTAFVGILAMAHDSKGRPVVNVAEFLHEGGTIAVTQKMRGLFFMLWLATTGQISSSTLTGRAKEIYDRLDRGRKNVPVVAPLRPGTTAIRIPRRPFIEVPFTNNGLRKTIQGNWIAAVERALRG